MKKPTNVKRPARPKTNILQGSVNSKATIKKPQLKGE